MKAAALGKVLSTSDSLQQLLYRSTHALMTQIAQSAACNRFHKVEARLARWLLMTHDRIGVDAFRLTQQFLSDMLGVRREGVTYAARDFQKDNLITYSRGHIRILNRAGLEAATCKCYSIIKAEYDSFLRA
jgi:CRP-like cAMP-binding protein